MINFDVNETESKIIRRIADRAIAMAAEESIDYDLTDAEMDIIATHANGCKLQLSKLLSAEPFDFAHDVFGIRRHLNRTTGQLENHFWPRYAS